MTLHRIAVISIILIAAVTVGAIAYSRWSGRQARPTGLIQVNGRIEGDRTTLAGKFGGRIARLLVREGDDVRQGQTVVQIDDPQTRARLDQARENLSAAVAQAEGAGVSVALTGETGDAQVLQARGVLEQAERGISAAREDTGRAAAGVTAATAAVRGAEADILRAQAAIAASQATKQRAEAGVSAAQAQVDTATAAVRAAQTAVATAQANYDRAAADARRYAQLLTDGAVSAQAAEQAETAARAAKAQLDGAHEGVAQAEAGVTARKAELAAAGREVDAARAAVSEARAVLSAARTQADAARATVRQAQAQYKSAQHGVGEAEARERQAQGQLRQAQTAPRQVAVSRTQQTQAQARIRQARAAITELRTTLDDMTVTAPIAGKITTRLVEAGEVVGAGTPLLEMVDLDALYLKAYVPEDQIGKVRLGLPARLYVDAYPDEPFEAAVSYIAAEAEFTPKEVQTVAERVKLVYAVKLRLLKNPGHRLTPGMPADAVIRWKEDAPWQKPRW